MSICNLGSYTYFQYTSCYFKVVTLFVRNLFRVRLPYLLLIRGIHTYSTGTHTHVQHKYPHKYVAQLPTFVVQVLIYICSTGIHIHLQYRYPYTATPMQATLIPLQRCLHSIFLNIGSQFYPLIRFSMTEHFVCFSTLFCNS
jgi:hypothetical protein